MQTVFRSEDMPAGERFDAFRQLASSIHVPMEVTSEHPHDFHAVIGVLGLGPVHLWPTTTQPVAFRRTPELIRRCDPENYHLTLVLRGTAGAVSGKDEVSYQPYDFHITSSSQARDFLAGQGPGGFRATIVELPRASLPLPTGLAQRVMGRALSGREGVGGLLATFLTRLATDAGTLTPLTAPRLGRVVTDLTAALLARSLEAERSLEPDTHHHALVLRVRHFIQAHVRDPDLSPGTIAAAHHISVGLLHKLFRSENTTVTALIRHQRLEGARRDLADPLLSAVPIHTIAASWGFRSHAVFTRAFAAAYGVPPRDARCPAVPRPLLTSHTERPDS
ncbi:helix-turn-helix domain-containing protein [Streptomyces sp. URMC 129]|uniref:AraC-like ligand-binding domain-containing protein n=1 Tax=Streptomyces sp. URMC 129 TaxID=3423407 RepID=UPI003F1B53E0